LTQGKESALVLAKDEVSRQMQTTREFLEQKIVYEKELMTAELVALRRQLDTAAIELSRRLDVLNHAHEASISDRTQFVQKDNYDTTLRDWFKWRDEVNAVLNNAAGRTAAFAAISSLLVGVIVLFISHFWK